MNFELEICANSVESCMEAQEGGATRIELCMGIPEGGTTPSVGMIEEAVKSVGIPVHVIIRPRGGDFCYTPSELRQMKRDITVARESGAAGVVFGCLDPAGNFDKKANEYLLDECKNLHVTFHRAIDVSRNPMEIIDECIRTGKIGRILTSGCASTALEGASVIKKMISHAKGRIGIMAGCGIRIENLKAIHEATGAVIFHSSLRHATDSAMLFRRTGVSMGGTVTIDEFKHEVTSSELVKKAVEILENL